MVDYRKNSEMARRFAVEQGLESAKNPGQAPNLTGPRQYDPNNYITTPPSDPSLATPTTPSRPNGRGSPSSPARYRWATLLARIYEVLPLRCPACGGEMKVLAFITDALTVRRILRHLGISPRPPPVAPAQRPPQQELEFDQTSAFDPTEPEPAPNLDFDQSVADEFD